MGTPVRIQRAIPGGGEALMPSSAHPAEGAISAIDPTIDDKTRNVKVRARVTSGARDLIPGMFVQVRIGGK